MCIQNYTYKINVNLSKESCRNSDFKYMYIKIYGVATDFHDFVFQIIQAVDNYRYNAHVHVVTEMTYIFSINFQLYQIMNQNDFKCTSKLHICTCPATKYACTCIVITIRQVEFSIYM